MHMNEKWTKVQKWMHRGLSGFLSLVMVFSMIQPGLASAAEYVCGKTEHSHGEACYALTKQTQQIKTLSCQAAAEAAYADLQGETADFLVHQHVAECFDGDGNQICPLMEILPHEHTEECYTVSQEPKCGLEETEGHTHGDCRKKLVCTDLSEGHTHGDACYEAQECLLEETEGHTHSDDCRKELTCGKEEIILHVHTEECGASEEETDTEAKPASEEDLPAAEGESELICTAPVVLEHVHDDSCFTVTETEVDVKTLICPLQEHTHDKTCEAEADKPEQETTTPSGTTVPEEDEGDGGETYAAYVTALAELEARVKNFVTLSPESEGYAEKDTQMWADFEAMEAGLGADKEAGKITVEEYEYLFGEYDRIVNLLFVDFVPEEEMSEYVSRDTLLNSLKNTSGYYNDVYIAVRKDGKLPGEPSYQGGENYLFFGDNGKDAQNNPLYKKNANINTICYGSNNGYISTGILDVNGFYTVGLNKNSEVAGLVDHTGVKTGAVLPGVDFDNLLEAVAATKTIKVNGVQVNSSNKDNYKVICYVIKYQHGSCKGWHIDCTVVEKSAVTLSYDMNLPSGYTMPGLTGLDADSKVPSDHDNNSNTPHVAQFTVKYPNVNGDVAVGKTVQATDADGKAAEFQFLGWRTSPGGSGKLYKPNDKISVSANTTLYAQWSTNLAIGSLSVKKTVTAPSGTTAPNTSFTFKVTGLPAGSYTCRVYNSNGTQASSATISNNGTFALKHTQYAIIAGIPKGQEVTVTETVPANYDCSWTNNAAQATISGGNTVELNCSNTYIPTTEITVTKTVVGTDGTFNFEVYEGTAKKQTISLKNGDSQKVTVTNGAQVSIKETNGSGYSTTYKIGNNAAATGQQTEPFTANGQTVAFTNTQYCTLKIKKEGVGTIPAGTTFPIQVKIGGAAYASKAYTVNGTTRTTDANGNISLAVGETAEISNILYGMAYEVSETPGDNYTVTYPGNNNSGTVTDGKEVTVTNTRKTAKITVKKNEIVGNAVPAADADKEFKFDVFWSDNQNNLGGAKTTVTVKAGNTSEEIAIPYGSYVKVVEQSNSSSGYTVTSAGGGATGDGTITFQLKSAKTVNVTFTNTQKGTLSITKAVNAPENSEFTVQVNINGQKFQDITLNPGETETILQLPVGVSYSIEETAASSAGYTVTYENARGTITTGTAATVTNTTDEETVSIPVSKIIPNTDGGEHTYYFKLTNSDDTLAADLVSSLPVPVSPAAAGAFSLKYTTDDLSDVAADASGKKVRTYTYKVIEVQSDGTPIAHTNGFFADKQAYTVTVTLTGDKNGLSSAFEIKDAAGTTVASNAFTNVLLRDLIIQKKMAEGSQDVGKPYTVDVTIGSNNFKQGMVITYPKLTDEAVSPETVTLTGAEKTITLMNVAVNAGGSATITGIPYGSTYTVTENVAYGYTPSYGNASEKATEGEITGDAPTATVINTERAGTLEIPVTKKLSNADGEDHGPYTFSLTQVKDAAGTALDDTVVNTGNDKADLKISVSGDAGNGSGKFDLDFRGMQLNRNAEQTFFFKVTEVDAESDFNVVYDDSVYVVEVKVSHDGISETLSAEVVKVHKLNDSNYTGGVEFTNTLQGSMKIVKKLELVEGSDKTKDRTFAFDVELVSKEYKPGLTYQVVVGGAEVSAKAAAVAEDLTVGRITLENVAITIPANDADQSAEILLEKIPAKSEFKVTERPETAYGYETTYGVSTENLLGRIFSDEHAPATGVIKALDQNEVVVVTVTNKELTAEKAISVFKDIVNPDNNKRTVYFELMECDEQGTPITGGTTRKLQAELKDDATLSFEAIPFRGTDVEDANASGGQKSRTFYYQIVETNADDIYTLDADQSKYIVEVTLSGMANSLKAEITGIRKDGKEIGKDAAVSFANVLLGSFTVRKSVFGSTSENFWFTITTGLSGSYPGKFNDKDMMITFTNGSISVKLGHGDSITVYGLPHGTEVTVQEEQSDNFVARHIIDTFKSIDSNTAKFEVSTAGVDCHFKNYNRADLPQTGRMIWVAGVLAILGAGLLGLGQITKKRNRKRKNGK